MSATGRNLAGHERRADDFYATPAWCTRAILPHLTPGPVLDPCCGEGAILDVVQDAWAQSTYGLELDASRCEVAGRRHLTIHGNALEQHHWTQHKQIITNPPYALAAEFIARALLETRDQYGPKWDAAFLLRINFLGSQKRAQFHREHPCDIYVLPRRPSFTNGGTDATEYAWMVWGPGRGNRWYMLDV